MRHLALILLLFPAAALAAEPTPPPPQPTPAPGAPVEQPGPDPWEDPELRATDTLPPDMLRRPRPPRPFGEPSVSPTLGIALSVRTVKNQPQLTTTAVDLWLGARFHPSVAEASPFVAFGAEVNFREMPQISSGEPNATPEESGSYTEVVPELRVGFAWLRTPTANYFNTVFPNLEVYAIGGWRLPNQYAPGAGRIGAGFSAPPLMLLLAYEIPLPTMVEVTMDVQPGSDQRDYAFRFGWHF